MIRLNILILVTFLFAYDLGAQFQPEYTEALEWREIGPYRGGRSCAVTGVAGQPNLFYFGATGGGVWRTKNGGESWENISDGFFGGSIGAVTVAPSDNNVLYVGGGEKTVRGNVSSGYGIWKSEDAGKTWIQKGLQKSRHISRIRVDPNNHNVVYAAVMGNLYKDSSERGVYKSNDGGDTWKKVLFANARTGAVDLIIDPNNPRILFATTWNIRRTPFSLESGGDGSALWKSSDYGQTWDNMSNNEGLPEGLWGISGITVSPLDSERLWLLVENKKGGVYRSDDGGKKWTKVNESRSLRQRAWYYTRIYADTKDRDRVYVMNVNYHRSDDGGKTFKSFRAPHGDHHDLWIAPEDPNRMIIGDDGGAQVTYDGGKNWTTYHNQPTAQFYRVTTDNHFPYRIYAAQQDNSTIRIAHRTSGSAITDKDWESTAGGESAHIAVDPTNPEIVYGGSYGGFMTRVDHETDSRKAINVWPDNPMGYGVEGMHYRFQWNFPIFFSKHDPSKLYAASNHLHLSQDGGQSWKTISDDLTTNDSTKMKSSGGPITKDNTGVEYYCTIFAAQESPVKKGLIWVGSDDGLLHVTKDGGANWNNVTPSNMPKNLMINCVEPDPHNEASCYIAGTLYKSGDFKPYIYKTSNYGATWTKIVSGIDGEHFTRAVRVDPNQEGLLYAGTETGMYISTNDGTSWTAFQKNLPIVPVTDLTIKNDNLIAATQGRGLWIIDDLNTLRQSLKTSKQSDLTVYAPAAAYRIRGRQNKNVKGAGMNHPGGVNTYYYLKEFDNKEDTITITYTSTSGDTIRHFSNHSEEKATLLKDIKAGSNVHNWNMKYGEAKRFDGMILWWGSLSGATAIPGEYWVSINLNGDEVQVPVEIKADPRLGISAPEYNAQHVFIHEVNDKVTQSHETIIEMRELKKQMSLFKKNHDNEEINNMIGEIDSTLTSIEKELYQTKNKSRQDPLNFPIKLTNKLAHLNSLIQIGDGAPTLQMVEVKEMLVGKIDEQLSKYHAIKTEGLSELNAMIKREVVDFIKVKKKK